MATSTDIATSTDMATSTDIASNGSVGDFNLRQFAIGMVSDMCGYVLDLESAMHIVKRFEQATTTKFSTTGCSSKFGNSGPKDKPHRVLWEHGDTGQIVVPFDGTPLMVLGTKYLCCQHGKVRHRGAELPKETKHKPRKRGHTKKMGCRAKIKMYEILKFPEYKIQIDSEKRRYTSGVAIKKALTDGSPAQERRIYVLLPYPDQHSGHPIGEKAGLLLPIDKILVSQIHNLVGYGVKNVTEMNRHLQIFVEQDLFRNQPLPSKNNRRYYPTTKTIRNHMSRTTAGSAKEKKPVQKRKKAVTSTVGWIAPGDEIVLQPWVGGDTGNDNAEEANVASLVILSAVCDTQPESSARCETQQALGAQNDTQLRSRVLWNSELDSNKVRDISTRLESSAESDTQPRSSALWDTPLEPSAVFDTHPEPSAECDNPAEPGEGGGNQQKSSALSDTQQNSSAVCDTRRKQSAGCGTKRKPSCASGTRPSKRVTYPRRTQVSRCRNLLSSIRDLVNQAVDSKSLLVLEYELQRAKENLENNLRKENFVRVPPQTERR